MIIVIVVMRENTAFQAFPARVIGPFGTKAQARSWLSLNTIEGSPELMEIELPDSLFLTVEL